jgi:hypothetical protein
MTIGFRTWGAAALACGLACTGAGAANAAASYSFAMVVSAGAGTCLPHAKAKVTLNALGIFETMHIEVSGLRKNTDYDVFVTQVPKAPFGVSWYQGDVVTDAHGKGVADFAGRFSKETFAVAPGSAPAPVVFNGPFPDASLNPAFNPIQTYHLGVWFNAPADAAAAGCPSTVTPFNGTHSAGIQVLNTSNFTDDNGPLRHFSP